MKKSSVRGNQYLDYLRESIVSNYIIGAVGGSCEPASRQSVRGKSQGISSFHSRRCEFQSLL